MTHSRLLFLCVRVFHKRFSLSYHAVTLQERLLSQNQRIKFAEWADQQASSIFVRTIFYYSKINIFLKTLVAVPPQFRNNGDIVWDVCTDWLHETVDRALKRTSNFLVVCVSHKIYGSILITPTDLPHWSHNNKSGVQSDVDSRS